MHPSTLLQIDGTIISQQCKGNVQQTIPSVYQQRQKHYCSIDVIIVI